MCSWHLSASRSSIVQPAWYPTSVTESASWVRKAPETKKPELTNRMILRVQCYAGRKADERPVRFQLGNREYVVEEVLDQWYGPDETFYKVCADDGNLYILRHYAAADEWRLESFRRFR